MTDQEILNGAKDIVCKGATSVSVTGLYLQKPFGITYFYSEPSKEWLKTDDSIFAGSRLLSDIRKIAELEKQLAEGEALVIELAAALEINQLRNE